MIIASLTIGFNFSITRNKKNGPGDGIFCILSIGTILITWHSLALLFSIDSHQLRAAVSILFSVIPLTLMYMIAKSDKKNFNILSESSMNMWGLFVAIPFIAFGSLTLLYSCATPAIHHIFEVDINLSTIFACLSLILFIAGTIVLVLFGIPGIQKGWIQPPKYTETGNKVSGILWLLAFICWMIFAALQKQVLS